MKGADGNPETNALRAGLTEVQLTAATLRSGYPLQVKVAQLLPEFDIAEEWGYIDRETNEARSLDIHAYKSLLINPASVFHPELTLLIECKRSDLPFVFFQAAIQALPRREYPKLDGFRTTRFEVHKPDGSGYLEATAAEFLVIREFPFVAQGPPVCRAFVKADRKGKESKDSGEFPEIQRIKAVDLSGELPYRSVIMPLVSAYQHWARMRHVEGDQARYYPSLTLMVCVFDAPMVLVSGPPEQPTLQMQPWVRVVRQESFLDHRWVSYRHFVIDCVHVDYLRTFVDDHVRPFGTQVATRIEEAKPLLSVGRATGRGSGMWEFKDLQAWA